MQSTSGTASATVLAGWREAAQTVIDTYGPPPRVFFSVDVGCSPW
jgi:hypothetical protein